jgi:hypothetical protein
MPMDPMRHLTVVQITTLIQMMTMIPLLIVLLMNRQRTAVWMIPCQKTGVRTTKTLITCHHFRSKEEKPMRCARLKSMERTPL